MECAYAANEPTGAAGHALKILRAESGSVALFRADIPYDEDDE